MGVLFRDHRRKPKELVIVMDGSGMGMAMIWMLLWGLVGLALLVLIIVAIVWLVRQLSAGPASKPPPAEVGGQARQELDRRLAAGEINQEEYRSLRAEIDRR